MLKAFNDAYRAKANSDTKIYLHFKSKKVLQINDNLMIVSKTEKIWLRADGKGQAMLHTAWWCNQPCLLFKPQMLKNKMY